VARGVAAGSWILDISFQSDGFEVGSCIDGGALPLCRPVGCGACDVRFLR